MTFNLNRRDRGFILIAITFFMLLIGVASVALNRKTALQSRMAQNQLQAAKTRFGQEASLEHAIWKLTTDPMWWSDTANKDFTYDGVTYTRTLQKSTVSGYTDATVVSVTAPGSQVTAKVAVRHYIRPPISAPGISNVIYQICMDSFGSIYFAVRDDHVIYNLNFARK